jgi:hypothetical protein
MSSNPEVDSLVPLRSYSSESERPWSEPAAVEAPAVQPEPGYLAPTEAPISQPAVASP